MNIIFRYPGDFAHFALAAGDFTPTVLQSVQLDADTIWADSAQKRSYIAEVEAAKAVISNQGATISPLNDPNKDYQVGINWTDATNLVLEDVQGNCDLDEPELSTKTSTYALDIFKATGFSVDQEKFRTNIIEARIVTAKGLMASMKLLDEYLSQVALTKLKAFSGTNVSPGAVTGGTFAGGTTTIPAANYNKSMVAGLIQTMILNRMRNSYLISDGELFNDFTNAAFDAGNLDGKGDKARYDALSMYWDLFNFAAAGITEDAFLVERSAVAFGNKARYAAFGPSNPMDIGGKVNQLRFSMPSYNIPGVRYDVFHETKCVVPEGETQDHIIDVYRLQVAAGFFLNPANAFTATNVGVLSFSKGA